MSAPRKIWLQEPVGLPGEEERSWCVEPQSDVDDLYHHDDLVRELAETLERAEMVMRMRGHLEMANECAAALAKIAQEDKP